MWHVGVLTGALPTRLIAHFFSGSVKSGSVTPSTCSFHGGFGYFGCLEFSYEIKFVYSTHSGKGRQTQRQKERAITHWFTPQMLSND